MAYFKMEPRVILLFAVTVAVSLAANVLHTGDPKVDARVRRIVGGEGVDGYTFAHLFTEDTAAPATKRDLIDHAARPSETETTLSLRLNSGERLRMSLRKRSVVDGDTVVVELEGDKETTRRLGERDCYFSGPTEGTDGHASLSMCGGRLMGAVLTAKRHYEIHALPESSTNRRATDPVQVLVTWSEAVHDDSKSLASDVIKRAKGDDESEDDDDDDKKNMEGLWDDVVEVEEEPAGNASVQTKARRSLSDRKATVEVANYLDKWYVTKVKQDLGLTTTSELTDMAIVKWNGVQAILGDANLIAWDIKIKLIKIVIWRSNPSWYSTSTSDTITKRVFEICTKVSESADQLTLSTSYTSDPGTKGSAYVGAVCDTSYKCSAVISADLTHATELKYIGYSLGLRKESEMGCPSGTSGFMANNPYFYRSDCYTAKLNSVFKNKNCLFSSASSSSYAVKGVLPGQTVGVKDQCEWVHGYGFHYLHIGDGSTMCAKFGCMLTDKSSGSDGTVRITKALDGTPCGKDKICRNTVCESISSSKISIDQSEAKAITKNGGWGSFGGWSSCSSSCGIAVKIARRYCNNPKPVYGAFCSGEKYKAQLCPSQPACSGEGSSESDLVSERGRVICQRMSLYYAYVAEGQRVSSSGVTEKCRVKCRKNNGQWSTEHYLLPDGTPCTGSDSPSSDASNGITRQCVKGRCMAFGCNGYTMGAGGGTTC